MEECRFGDCGICVPCIEAAEIQRMSMTLERNMRHVETLQQQYLQMTGRRFVRPLRFGGCNCNTGQVLIVSVTETVATTVDAEPCIAVHRGLPEVTFYCPHCGVPVVKKGATNG